MNNNYVSVLQKSGRVYKISDKMFEVPNSVIEPFKIWNTSIDKKNNIEYDKRMVRVILLMCVDASSLAKFEIDEGTKKFMFGK